MFWTWWQEGFGEVLPLGFVLRAVFVERWFRIHSLTDSKRYAEDDAERSALLQRQHLLAEAVLGEGSACFVVVPRFETLAVGTKRFVTGFPELEFVCAHHANEDDLVVSFLVAESVATADLMKGALLAIADDEARGLWVNRETREVFAPYDGGVDVICASPPRRAELAAQFREWLSPRPDGL